MNYSSMNAFVVAATTAEPIAGPAEPELTITNGDLTLTEASGQITITITAPVEYAGSYDVNASALALGPVNVVPPLLTLDRDTLHVRPGLWLFNEQVDPLAVSYVWKRGALVLETTGTSYTLEAADAGQALSVTEVATDWRGSQNATSNVITTEGAEPTDPLSSDAGALFWYDETGLTIDGDNVTAWADRSGQSRTLTAPAGSEPGLAGTNAVTFAGSQALIHGSPSGIAQAEISGSLSVFFVGDISADQRFANYFHTILSEGDATSGSAIMMRYENRTPPVARLHHDSSSDSTFGVFPTATAVHTTGIMEVRINGTTEDILWNGTVLSSQTITSGNRFDGSTGGFALGRDLRGQRGGLEGSLREVFATTTISNATAIRQHLADKHGVTL